LLTTVRQRLAGSRVVTLTGPGGVGKTRVALRVMELERGSFREGCWAVDLNSVGSVNLVVPTIAASLGLQADASSRSVVGPVADFVADRQALLVLDGCEHLLDAVAAVVVELRAACPRLRMLGTSRQALGISGETIVAIPPLTVPDPTKPASTPDALTLVESVELFVDRAGAANSAFALSADNATPVAALCAQLEGVPLAIELAAARSSALSPQDMLGQLGDRYRLLDRGYRDAAERHRSVRACVGWSFGLCTDDEQELWCRMSVLAGGGDLAGIEAVCAGDGLEQRDILNLVDSLVAKSVVRATHARDGTVRFAMHTDVATYGVEQLRRLGLLDRWRERQATWCAALAARFRADWVGGRQRELLLQVRREHGNIRAALEFCAAKPVMAETGLLMAVNLDSYWVTAGLADDARHWLEVGLASEAGKPAERALAMVLSARYAGFQHDLAATHRWMEQASETAEEADDDLARGLLQVITAMLAVWRGDGPAAVDACQRALPLLHVRDHPAAELLALSVAGVCLGLAGESADAEAALERAVVLAADQGEIFRRSYCLAGLGELALAAGDLDRATARFREALRMKAELGDRMGVAVCLDSLGRAAVAEGDAQRAALLLGAAASIWDAIGMHATGNPFVVATSPVDTLGRASSGLERDRFRADFRLGSALTDTDAIALALGSIDDRAATSEGQVTVDPSPLTRRESEVAELVAEGLSNPQIAERLVISVRTAEGHVENVLRKLGFTSRARIATWVTERRALVAGPRPG
jgi:non-specific serine/threonine protein kinase